MFHGSQEICTDALLRFSYLSLRYPYPLAGQVYVVQFLRPGTQPRIAMPPHIRNDLGRGPLSLQIATLPCGQ